VAQETGLTRLAPRREPRQARSRERVARILKATAKLVERGGVAAVNTNAIAKLAQLPVGTLYQFFPNRESVLQALMQSQLEQFDTALWPLLAESNDTQPLKHQVGHVVDALATAYLKVPALATLLRALRYDASFAGLSAHNNAVIAEAIAALVRRRSRTVTARRARAVGVTLVEAADGVLMAWLQSRDPALLRELKALILAYGATLLPATEHE
jgi:AcrR family transcriptional regulator